MTIQTGDMRTDRTSAEVARRILWILRKKDLKQKDLARMLGKNDSEVSVWLSGRHNFTISTIERVEKVLGRKIIRVVGNMEDEES